MECGVLQPFEDADVGFTERAAAFEATPILGRVVGAGFASATVAEDCGGVRAVPERSKDTSGRARKYGQR